MSIDVNEQAQGVGSLVIFKSSLPDEMAVAKLVPEVAMSYRFRVSVPYPFDADERAEHCKMSRDGIVQSYEKAVHGMYETLHTPLRQIRLRPGNV